MHKTKVFLTFDTEVWKFYTEGFEPNYNSSMYGIVGKNQYGLGDQLALLNDFNLCGNFFVDSLFSMQGGPDSLQRVVDDIVQANQDVQLHIHTEWLERTKKNPLESGREAINISEFTLDEQIYLIGEAKKLLERAGAPNVCAFRAGNYGADNKTLEALGANGIKFDSSYNYPYLGDTCGIQSENVLYQPAALNGIIEYPVTFFEDRPNSQRHLQLMACSFSEFKTVLDHAHKNQWDSVVVVLHSFEWVQRSYGKVYSHYPDRIVRNRFIQLCKYLANNPDRFQTCKFSELEQEIPEPRNHHVAKSNWLNYGERQLQQFFRKVENIFHMSTTRSA